MVSVVIPAVNEEGGVRGVLEQIRLVLDENSIEGEIILVDDGSTDRTAEEAQGCEGVTVLRHRENRGYGAALKTGIRHASHDLVFITDADGTYPNRMLPELLSRLEAGRLDMVVGARTGETRAIPWVRRPAKWFIGRLASFIAGVRIQDVNSGMRLFRREVALQHMSLFPDGFSFTTTITLAMLVNGYLVEDVEVDYRPRIGRSKIRPVHDTLNFIQLVLRMGLYFAPLKIFVPLATLLMFLAVGWGTFSHIVLGRLADVSSLVIAMTAIQISAVGMVAELINQRVPKHQRED
ncbi:MAG: glycosyltransferase family 2 protein [Longimicrobiales bacterium]